ITSIRHVAYAVGGEGFVERLGASDYEAVLGFLHQLYAPECVDAFPRRALTGLSRLIESDILTYSKIDPQRQHVYMLQEPAGGIALQTVGSGARGAGAGGRRQNQP